MDGCPIAEGELESMVTGNTFIGLRKYFDQVIFGALRVRHLSKGLLKRILKRVGLSIFRRWTVYSTLARLGNTASVPDLDLLDTELWRRFGPWSLSLPYPCMCAQ